MLQKIEDLFDALEQDDIRYCNWKSNKDLKKSLNGEIDIELLCDRKDATEVRSILAECNYKEFPDVSFANFPGITNYIGFDEETGRLIHVHLHYELTFGTPYLKEYVSPWGSYVLDKRIKDSETDVWVSDPNVEVILLLIRYAMKIRRWNVIARRSYFEAFIEEYKWLRERSDLDTISTVCQDLLTDEASLHVEEMIKEGPKISHFHRLRTLSQSELQPYNTHRTTTSSALALLRKGFRGFGKLNEKILNRPIPTRRSSSPGGIEIAFIGIDGSGKSTHVNNIREWLSWKVDVHQVYFGSGDGRSSLLRYPLKKLNEIRRRFNSEGGNQQEIVTSTSDSSKNKIPSVNDESSEQVGFAKALWALTLAREKRNKRRRSKRARNRGLIVLMDRYPQYQFPGHNDGPLLRNWKDSEYRLLRWLSKWEVSIYQYLHNTPPDLIIKLHTSPSIAKQRKPETPLRELEKKSITIDQLEYDNGNCDTVIIDTEQDIDVVCNEIKKEIWNAL